MERQWRSFEGWFHEHWPDGHTYQEKNYPDRLDQQAVIRSMLEEAYCAGMDAGRTQLDYVTDNAVALLSGGCEKHPELSFDQFVETGGGTCSVCLTYQLKQMQAMRDKWLTDYRIMFEMLIRTKRQPTPLPPNFKYYDVVLFSDILAILKMDVYKNVE